MNPESVSSFSGLVKLRPARHRFMSIPLLVLTTRSASAGHTAVHIPKVLNFVSISCNTFTVTATRFPTVMLKPLTLWGPACNWLFLTTFDSTSIFHL